MAARRLIYGFLFAVVMAVAIAKSPSVWIECTYFPYCFPFVHPIERPTDGGKAVKQHRPNALGAPVVAIAG